MSIIHMTCGYEVESSSVEIECPVADVGVLGVTPAFSERTTRKIIHRAFCPKCRREVYADEIMYL